MNSCAKCGKRIRRGFKLCYDCSENNNLLIAHMARETMTPDELDREREEYYSNECVMCGKEGASLMKDGRTYCSMCWTVWNS